MPGAQRIRCGSHGGWRSDWARYNLRMLWTTLEILNYPKKYANLLRL